MSLACLSTTTLGNAQRQFEHALPQIERVLRYHFRHLPSCTRDKAISDARAAAWQAWHGIVRRGKNPLTVGPTGIAANACRYTQAGRRLGCGSSGRGAMDVYNHRAQRRLGLKLIRLDRQIEMALRTQPDAWREWLAEDNRVSPADEACFRLDFVAWLEGLPRRKREMAELPAEGHETGAAAERLGVTPSSVSQTRTWLEASWRAFQGEAGRTDAPSARWPRGRPKGSGHHARGRKYVPFATHVLVETS